MASIAIVILAHDDPQSLVDLSNNISYFCPECVPFLYNSGTDPKLGEGTDLELIPSPQKLEYARIMPFFLDVFDWFLNESRRLDYLVNAETDMLFIRRGYSAFVEDAMDGYDYMAPLYGRGIPSTCKWRPYRSLRPELDDWMRLRGLDSLNRAFSPAQVFSREYVERLLNHSQYLRIRELVRKNSSFTLQEVLNPTLADFLKLRGRSYPEGMEPVIRYRPFQAVSGVRRALDLTNAFLIHPVRREQSDPARQMIVNMANIL